MKAPVVDDPCILFALGREALFFRRQLGRGALAGASGSVGGAPCRAQFYAAGDVRVLVLETGVGPARAEAALEWLRRGLVYRPRFILSAGFSGALQPGIRVGDVVLATEVADLQGDCWPATWPDYGGSLNQGRLLTVPQLLGDPAEKSRLGQQFGAVAVDMETATVARVCSRHGIPFGCVRAISDDLHTALSPRLVSLLAGGRVSPLRVLAAVTAHPRLLGQFWRLARQTRVAARQLGTALDSLLRGNFGDEAAAKKCTP
jgi:adenosylhomocysteine nucleosidase